MKNKNILILALIGYGLYWYFKKKNTPVVTNVSPVTPDTSSVMPTVATADVNVRYAITGLKKFGNVPNTI